MLKADGDIGDFIIYRKLSDPSYPIRICYLSQKDNQKRINKLQVRESKDGKYSILKPNAPLFESVSALIDGSGDVYGGLLKKSYLGVN